MKNIVIFDCGPSLSAVSKLFGCAPDWIIEILKNKKCRFKWVKSYAGETVEDSAGDAWIITGSPRSVYDELNWMLEMEEKIRNAQYQNNWDENQVGRTAQIVASKGKGANDYKNNIADW